MDRCEAENPFVIEAIAAAVAKRRRLAAAAAVLSEGADSGLGPTGPKVVKNADRDSWDTHVRKVGSARTFQRMYRVDLQHFHVLLEMIRTQIETDDVGMAVRSAGSEVCAEFRLAMALRYLAGGSVWDIRLNCGVSSAEFYRSVWRVIDAINGTLIIDFPLDDEEELARLEREFAAKSRQQVMRGVVGALDGCIIAQKNPGAAVENPRRYFCARKDKFGLLLMAICDARRRFLYIDLSCTPTTHDSLAWLSCQLAQDIEEGKLPSTYYLLGDNAFTCTRSMITPGSNDDFNYEQSRLRINIECAFGELVRRWGILWRPLEMAFDKRTAVIGACCRLHNFCVDRRLELEADLAAADGSVDVEIQPGEFRRPPSFDKDGRPVDFLETSCEPDYPRSRDKADTSKREELEQAVINSGLRRPPRRL